MSIINIIRGLAHRNKLLDKTELPSKGLFYPSDMKIYIGKCAAEDICAYEENFNGSDILSMGYCVKAVIDKYVTLNKKYTTSALKSIDMLYILLEIVKYTKGKEIYIKYYDDTIGDYADLSIGKDTFNYIDTTDLDKYYDSETREFVIDGYRFSIPSKGIEKSLTEYLSANMTLDDIDKLDSYNYDFIYFLGNRDFVTFDEIDNLIEIFNNDMDDENKAIVSNIVTKFSQLLSYSLIKNGRVVDFRSKLDLGSIWH